jgi:hypothetical protein
MSCDTSIIEQILSIIFILITFCVFSYLALYVYLVFVVKDKIKRGMY